MFIKVFKYVLLWAPAGVLAGFIVIVACSHWVARVLNEPASFQDAPEFIQSLARAIYSHTRTIWQAREDCVRFDPVTLYVPVVGNCHFSNIEFSTEMSFVEPGVRRTSGAASAGGPGEASTPRVLILGDSYAMGWGVHDDETFGSILASRNGFRTINLGVSSYGTAREFLRLRQLDLMLPGDILVVQYFDNDFAENVEFATNGTLGRYSEDRFATLVGYEPARQSTLAIAGVTLRLLFLDVSRWFRSHLAGNGDGRDEAIEMTPATAFLGVYDRFPELRRHPMILMPVNVPGRDSHILRERKKIEDRGIRVLTPNLKVSDFLAIDTHWNAEGHHSIADQLANEILKPIGR